MGTQARFHRGLSRFPTPLRTRKLFPEEEVMLQILLFSFIFGSCRLFCLDQSFFLRLFLDGVF